MRGGNQNADGALLDFYTKFCSASSGQTMVKKWGWMAEKE
jgi:hypothetical protein